MREFLKYKVLSQFTLKGKPMTYRKARPYADCLGIILCLLVAVGVAKCQEVRNGPPPANVAKLSPAKDKPAPVKLTVDEGKDVDLVVKDAQILSLQHDRMTRQMKEEDAEINARMKQLEETLARAHGLDPSTCQVDVKDKTLLVMRLPEPQNPPEAKPAVTPAKVEPPTRKPAKDR